MKFLIALFRRIIVGPELAKIAECKDYQVEALLFWAQKGLDEQFYGEGKEKLSETQYTQAMSDVNRELLSQIAILTEKVAVLERALNVLIQK